MIHRLCAVSLVVLITLPFTAPFAMFDLRDGGGRTCATATRGTAATAAADDGAACVWIDRTGRHHHAMPLAALNSGQALLDVAFQSPPLPPSAVTCVASNTPVIATVLRI